MLAWRAAIAAPTVSQSGPNRSPGSKTSSAFLVGRAVVGNQVSRDGVSAVAASKRPFFLGLFREGPPVTPSGQPRPECALSKTSRAQVINECRQSSNFRSSSGSGEEVVCLVGIRTIWAKITGSQP